MRFKEFMFESIEDKGIMKAIFIVGIPGSGKSYSAKKLSGTVSPKIVNTDRAIEYFIMKGHNVTPDTWPKFKDDSHRITKSALGNYLNSMLPLFIDGTSNDASNVLARAGILESLGYDVGMVFIETSLETAIRRANERLKITGREVGEDFIRHVEKQSEENRKFFASKFSFFKTIKNDDGELDDATLTKAFKAVQQFYNEDVQNPVGKRFLEKMREDKLKYLADVMDQDVINRKLDGWYK